MYRSQCRLNRRVPISSFWFELLDSQMYSSLSDKQAVGQSCVKNAAEQQVQDASVKHTVDSRSVRQHVVGVSELSLKGQAGMLSASLGPTAFMLLGLDEALVLGAVFSVSTVTLSLLMLLGCSRKGSSMIECIT